MPQKPQNPKEILTSLAVKSVSRLQSGGLLERKACLLICLTIYRHFRVKSTFKTEERKPCKHAHAWIRIHPPEIRAPLTYTLCRGRKSSKKPASSGRSDYIRGLLMGTEEDARFSPSPPQAMKKKSPTVVPSHIRKDVLAPPSSSSEAALLAGEAHPLPLGPHPMPSLPALGTHGVRAHRATRNRSSRVS